MSSDSAVNTVWLVFNLTGQWCLLILLLTFYFVKHLPQRGNPFLVNFLLTTFLGTIPPAILLYSGQQSAPSTELCFAQAALVDGVPPMFGAAQVVLIFDTWSELRSICHHKRRLSRTSTMKYTLIVAPYMLMWIWVFASFIAAAQSKATHKSGFVYCKNSSGPSDAVRMYVGLFMLAFVMIELAFGLCIGWLLCRFPARIQKDSTAWRSHVHVALRITTLGCLQLIALILSASASVGAKSPSVQVVYELLTSMNALAAFIAFATQRTVLQAWKIRSKTKLADGSQPPVYSMEWANVPQRRSPEIFEEAFDHGQGRVADVYFRPWLRVGETS